MWHTVPTAPSGGKGSQLTSVHSVDVVILGYFMLDERSRGRLGNETTEATGTHYSARRWTRCSGARVELVDAVVFKDRLASQLLPTITYLQAAAGSLRPCMRRNGRSAGGTRLARIFLFAGLLEIVLGVAFLAAQVPRTEIRTVTLKMRTLGCGSAQVSGCRRSLV